MRKNKMKILFFFFAVIVGLFTLIQMPFLLPIGLGAVLTSGILGPGKGKVGGAVMSKWKSINYIRAYAIPKNPDSPDQQTQRARFKSMILLAQKLMSMIIPQCWDPFYDTMSGFNALAKENFPLLDVDDLATIDFVSTKGTLEEVPITSATYTTGTGSTSVVWSGDVFGNGLATDQLVFVIVDTTDNVILFQGILPAVTRVTEIVVVVAKTGRVATDLVCCLSAFRGVGVDYIQSNNTNVAGQAI